MKVDDHVDIKRYWEVMYRTLGRSLGSKEWHYEDGEVVIKAKKYCRYTVSFPAYIQCGPAPNEIKLFEKEEL